MMYLFLFFIFLFGLTIGSFLNCMVWRIYKEESAWGRSYCPKCRKLIRWFDNVPVLSYLFLRGRCRDCGKGISWQYPVVELVTGALFVYVVFNNFQFPILNLLLPVLFQFFVISVLIMIFIFDLKWYIIPDIVTIPAIIITIIFQLILNIHIWQNLVISGIIGLGFFLFQFVISRGKWIGGGDLRLGLLMGLVLGWPKILAAIVLSYLMGSLVAVYLLLSKKKQLGGKIPLGTFLTAGTLIVLFWGEKIIDWYLGIVLF
jgi:leader peptidase (prepilin peptidase)/N-methyltransferase